jgi:crotonobetainyl-CoA:carnitine CoA-transferase CaiB-like acyl-CoA transferase
MTALELMERLGGEILNNKVRATIDGEIVILARLNDQEWELTEKGQELANLHSNLVVDEAAAAKPTRKKAAPAVESEAAPVVDTPAAETPAAE